MNHISADLESTLKTWRHELHRNPEFGFKEFQTAEFIAQKLRSFGLEVFENIGQTGVVGVLTNGDSDRSIGLRADMDALQIQELNDFDHRSNNDGMMHACGHDGHSTMLLGAASHLASTMNFDGSVYFIFQPAEEHGKGALSMIEDGLFERFQISSVFGLHNLPGLPLGEFAIRPGSLMASESGFEINLFGRGGHAAMPHMGVDTLLLASQCVVALQTVVSRNMSALHESAVVSVTEFITDGTVNVIPSKVTLKGDCRCFTDEAIEKIKTSMERIIAGLCDAAGATYEFEFITTFPSTINNPAETLKAVSAARAVFGEGHVNPNCDAYTISEDFSNMLRVKPGCYGLIGNGGGPDGGCALHNPKYDFNDSILAQGCSYWIQLAEEQLKK